jgi:putative membrane-bound dehydrogenase-like protein
MIRWSWTGVILAVAIGRAAGGPPEAARTHQVQLNGHTFTLPAGFDIELVAGSPLVDRPIEADFDEQGRLYVSDSSGSNDPVPAQLQKKPHRILRLEDTTGAGRFDRRSVFADRMMFPEGVLWHAGSLYVAAVPSIWKLTDTKGDGTADQRSEWFQGKTHTGCANDLHGPYFGPDGWIYWCKGAFDKQTYPRPPRLGPLFRGKREQPPFVTRAAHIFRCRPDGSGIEPVMTGGMDNPVEVVFTAGGERIFTTTFLQQPGGGRRDGLIHAVYGGIYGKDHGVIYEHPWTGPTLMPVLTHLGAAAPCGLVRYESVVFGDAYKDNLFACLFNMHKVTRHVLTPDGATFKSRDEDFLVSSNLDFHPTDVLEDADGSLLVIDTGGWYKLCCPTSQLHKPDILGAIYRIRRQGAPRLPDPRGLKLAWEQLSPSALGALLGDSRPAVRRRAVQALAGKGADAVPVLEKVVREGRSVEVRRNAVWAACRIDQHEARAVVRQALNDSDETVRQVALHSVSVWRDQGALAELLTMLQNASLQNRRAAAEALGRIGDTSAVAGLLHAVGEVKASGDRPSERVLEHSLAFALMEIGDRETVAAGLRSPNPAIRRAALSALDQMPGGGLEAATVATELTAADPRLKASAWWIAGRHAEWGGALAGFLRDRLAAQGLTSAEREELAHQLAQFAKGTPVQALLAEQLREAGPDSRRTVLRAMALSGLKEAPPAWLPVLTGVLSSKDGDLVREAVATARVLRIPPQHNKALAAVLLKIGQDTTTPVPVRVTALAAIPGGLNPVEPPVFAFLQEQLTPEQPTAVRSVTAEVLAHAGLTKEQLTTLTDVLKTVGPMELDRLLDAFTRSTDADVGRHLVAALQTCSARSSLRVETLKPRLAKFGPTVARQAEDFYAALDVDARAQRARLEQLLTTLKGGDVRRGQAVFNNTRASCSACHAIGYLGGNVGPDLTHIGKTRSSRDLLEAIVFPSASFVRSYEPVLVATKDGKVYNGLIRKDTPEEIVLATGVNQEVRLAREDIEDVQPSKVSVMPSGLDQQLSPQELADLVAFLQACK